VNTIEAAILMSDMRGFTAMSNRQSLADVIHMLDAWFECVATAVEAHQGEILKFMGDGLLAIFPAEESGSACCRALAAAADASAAVDAMNADRRKRGEEPIAFVTGLHVGSVAYGNVGGRTRLDFTVLGPAVNYASRLQELAKQLGRPVLVSAAFAAAAPNALVDLGPHPLRGIGAAERVFSFEVPAIREASRRSA
jgi:adenylate cyclase